MCSRQGREQGVCVLDREGNRVFVFLTGKGTGCLYSRQGREQGVCVLDREGNRVFASRALVVFRWQYI